MAELNSPIK